MLDGGYGECCGGLCIADTTSIESCALCGLGCLPCPGSCPSGTLCVEQGLEVNGGGVVPIESCLPIYCPAGQSGSKCAFGPAVQGVVVVLGPENQNEGPFADLNAGFCCNGVCVDIAQDPNNCGFCGEVCPSGICAIAYGQFASCVRPQPDSDCLATCGQAQVCAQGVCVDAFCPSPSGLCAAADGNVGLCCLASNGLATGGPCADLANDPLSCGGCGFVCPPGQSCHLGVCSGTPANCGVGRIGAFCDLDAGPTFVCCPGVGCTNLATDHANCGACSVTCPPGETCTSGRCQ